MSSFGAAVVDSIDSLSHRERWSADSFTVSPKADSLLTEQVDMSWAEAAVLALRSRGIKATYTHVLVRAAALALRRCPEAHQLVAGYRRLRPTSIDIGLSVAGQLHDARVLVVPQADQRKLPELAEFLIESHSITLQPGHARRAGVAGAGWLVPLGFVRRLILRMRSLSLHFRRRHFGTFQVMCVPSIDCVLPLLFHSGSMLAMGQVRPRVLIHEGKPAVRPGAIVTVALDQRTIESRIAAKLLQTVRQILESDELLLEAGVQLEAATARAALPHRQPSSPEPLDVEAETLPQTRVTSESAVEVRHGSSAAARRTKRFGAQL